MSASLMAELAAIESMMLQRAADTHADPCQSSDLRNQCKGLAGTEAPNWAVEQTEPQVENEHTCSICLVSQS